MNVLSVIFDIIVVVTIILVTATSMRRGIIASIIEFVGTIVSVVLSTILGSAFANLIYNQFLQDNIINGLTKAMSGAPDDISSSLFKSLPGFAQNGLRSQGINESNILSNMGDSLNIPTAIESTVAPIIISFITKIAITIIFTVLLVIVIAISSKHLNNLCLNELKTASTFVGMIFGILKSLILLMIIVVLIETIVMIMPYDSAIIYYQAVDSSMIYKLFNTMNIPLTIISLVTGK